MQEIEYKAQNKTLSQILSEKLQCKNRWTPARQQ